MMNSRIAVLGSDANAAGEALFLRAYTSDITLMTLGTPVDLGAEDLDRIDQAGIPVLEVPVSRMTCEPGRVAITLSTGDGLTFDAVYSGLGSEPNTQLAAMLGVDLTPEGRVVTDAKQQTSVAGVYAAGDAVTGLNQIAVAMAQAEIASVDIHNSLRRMEGLTLCA
jgi:thioredoxin reductase (NADPH)